MKHTSKQEQSVALDAFYQEMSAHIQELQDDLDHSQNELKFLQAFISCKGLDSEYKFFKENAHEEWIEDLPFPRFTL